VRPVAKRSNKIKNFANLLSAVGVQLPNNPGPYSGSSCHGIS
jgi:hypothetical protein